MKIPLEIGVAVQNEAAFSRLPDRLPEPLTLLAVPGELLESAEQRKKLNKLRRNGVDISIAELAAGPLTRLVPGESETVRFEFYRMATERFRQAAAMEIREIGLGFDLERALREEEFRMTLERLLRGLWGVAAELGVRLRLPVRLPLPPGSPGLEIYRKRLIEILPEATSGVTLDFHMHDPAVPEMDFGSLLKCVRFDSDSWRISYEPELGNRLVPERLSAVLEAAGGLCRLPRRVVFAPVYSAPGMLATELPDLATQATQLKK